jgi:glycosyltransferase involved in cell wall biosynthesis
MKKISIITPSFNQGKYLEQTIDSVLSQNYPDLEYLIIDGGSTDNSVEIIKKHEKYLTYWVSEKDNGQSHAINKGLKMANGEIVNWINSDDWYNPNALQKVADYFNDDNVLVVSGRSDVWKSGKFKVCNPGVDVYPNLEKTVGWARIDQPETFFRMSAVKKMGFLNETLHFVMDREWWIRFLMYFGQENVLKVEDVFVNFRLHEDSKTFNYQTHFDNEGLNVYYTMAKQNKLEEALIFENNFNVEYLESLQYQNIANKELLQKIIHYFWLLNARLKYAEDDLETAKKFIQNIDTDFISTQDVAELNKLKRRISLMPLWLKKILNKRF